VSRTITPPEVRFERHVDRSGGPDACHPYTGATVAGYGRFWITTSQPVGAHRFAWEQVNGPIPEGAHVDHVCHNGTGCPGGPSCPHRRCCNDRHLEPTTGSDNVDRSHNARQHRTRCPHGHDYTPANTLLRPPLVPGRRPRRACRTCVNAYYRRRHAAKRAAS
jgi:hypothetical protein